MTEPPLEASKVGASTVDASTVDASTGAASMGAAANYGGPVPDLNPALAQRLSAAGLDPGAVRSFVVAALAEDLAGGIDVTTAATVPRAAHGRADLVARTAGVVAGLPVAEAVFRLVSPDVQCAPLAADGDRVAAGQALLAVSGPLGPILTAERTALNLLCHLSGVATLTSRWVDAVAGTGARIRDTRKTLPGLRALEKYAVRCGGGVNHRMSLSDAALIKDNHVAAAGSVGAAFAAVRAQAPGLPLEVECDTLDQVAEALTAGADLILLDNFDVPELAAAVRLAGGRALLEASGGLTLTAARAVAETGVDYLAVGALTHSAPALDIGLDLVQAG
jgi:nicotinate-nucleotide pyrophosphorylase (carboxylating)